MSAFISTVYRLSNLRIPLLCALQKKIVSVGRAAAEYPAHMCVCVASLSLAG